MVLNKFPESEDFSEKILPNKKYAFMEVYSTTVAAFSFLCTGLLRAYTSPAILSMETDPDLFNTTSMDPKTVLSWVASSPPLASCIGTILSGPMLQYCGRQKTIVLLTLPLLFGWLLIGFSRNVFMVISGRLLTGLAAGIATAAAQLYCAECVRAKVRGTLGFLPSMMLALGVLLGFAASMISAKWRELAFIMLTFPLILFIMSITIPESPIWLILRNKDEEAAHNLSRFRENGTDLCEINEEIKAMKLTLRNQRMGTTTGTDLNKQSFWVIIQKKNIWFPAFIAVSLMTFQQFAGGNVIIFFLSVILREAEPKFIFPELEPFASTDFETNSTTPSLSTDVIKIQMLSPNISSVIVGLVQFLGFFLSLPLIDRMGRKILLISSAILMTLPFTLLGFYFYCNLNLEFNPDLEYFVKTTSSWLPLTCLCIYVAAYSIGFGPVPFIIMAEIFSTQTRSYLCSLTSFVNHFMLFIVVKTFPILWDKIGPHCTFWMFACSCMASVLFVVIFVPETKGMTLEEIEKHFSKKESQPLLTTIGR